jgi:hypothetical protein
MFLILFYTLTISHRPNRGSVDAARELERFSAPVSGVLPGLSLAGDDAHKIPSLAPGTGGSIVRRLYAVYALGQAGIFLNDTSYIALAARTLRRCTETIVWNEGIPTLVVDGESAGLLGLLELVRLAGASYAGEDEAAPLINYLVDRLLRSDGRVSLSREPSRATDDHDFLPGYAIHALAEGMRQWPNRSHLDRLRVSLEWNRRRASHVRTWGMIGWLPRCVRGPLSPFS